MIYYHIFQFQEMKYKDEWLIHYYYMNPIRTFLNKRNLSHYLTHYKPTIFHFREHYNYHAKQLIKSNKPTIRFISQIIAYPGNIWDYYTPFSFSPILWNMNIAIQELRLLDEYETIMLSLLSNYKEERENIYHSLYCLWSNIPPLVFLKTITSLMEDPYTTSIRSTLFIEILMFIRKYKVIDPTKSMELKLAWNMLYQQCNEWKIDTQINHYLTCLENSYLDVLRDSTNINNDILRIILSYSSSIYF